MTEQKKRAPKSRVDLRRGGRFKCPECGSPIALPRPYDDFQKRVLATLKAACWCRAEAARRLNVGIRSVQYWIRVWREMGIEIPDSEIRGRGDMWKLREGSNGQSRD